MQEERAKIQSIDRAVEVIDYLSRKSSGERLTTIAKDLSLNKSTAFGIVSTLRKLNILNQNPENEKYFLGYRLIRYGMIARTNVNYLQTARKYLQPLAERIGVSTHVSVLSGTEAILVDKIDGVNRRVATRIGDHFPIHCAASGKVLTAFSDLTLRERLLLECKYQKRTENTITSRADFERVIAQVEKDGYAVDKDEAELGRSCISAPILDAEGYAIAAFSLTFASEQMLQEDENVILEVKQISRDISLEMGCPL